MVRDHTEFEELRRRISRLRRRIDRNGQRLVDGSIGWLAWRGPVARHPARALAAAVALGFVLSSSAKRIEWPSRFGARLYRLAVEGAWGRIWALIRRVRVRRSPPHHDEADE
jgi:hypothetical protein